MLSDDLVRALTLVVSALPMTMVAQGAGTASAVEALLADVRCQATIRGQLEEWDARPDAALPDPPGPTGLRSMRMPTGAIGLWARLAETSPHEAVIERITATRTERMSFTEACVGIESAVAMPQAPDGAFTDSDLIGRVAGGERGVVLLWSPHMPLSVDQHAVLADVARELGLAVVPLLDPGADADYAGRVVRERGLRPEATRLLGGIELAFRGMTTHTPSLQVFAGGKLIGPVLYGYRNAAVLRATLEQALAGR